MWVSTPSCTGSTVHFRQQPLLRGISSRASMPPLHSIPCTALEPAQPHPEACGRSQNTVPIASTQVAIKGIIQYSTRLKSQLRNQSGAVLSRTQLRAHALRSRSRRTCRIAQRLVTTSCTYVSAINTTNFIQCNRCVQM